MTKVFVSYSRRNKSRALKLSHALTAAGVSVWFDDWDVLVGHKLADQIYRGIRESDYLLVVLTQASSSSRWVKEELDYAHVQELGQGGTKIIPLLYEHCEIPDSLKSKAYADFTVSFDRGFAQLMKSLQSVATRNEASTFSAYDQMIAAVHISRKLQLLIMYTAPLLEGQPATDVLSELRSDVEALSRIAVAIGMNRAGYAWLATMLSAFETGKAAASAKSSSIERRRELLYLWIRGTCLYRGGFAYRSSLPARAVWETAHEDDPLRQLVERELHGGDGTFWRGAILRVAKELPLSRHLQTQARSGEPEDRLRDAFVLELMRLSDYGSLRRFVDRRKLAGGVEAGFLSVIVMGVLPVSAERDDLAPVSEAQLTQFKHMVETLAGFLVSNFEAVAEADRLMEVVFSVMSTNTFDLPSMNILLSMQQPLYQSALDANDQIAGRGFRLGALIGKLFMWPHLDTGEGLPLSLAAEAEELLEQLAINPQLRKATRDLVDAARHPGGGEAFRLRNNNHAKLIGQLSRSFLDGSSYSSAEQND